MQIIISVVVYIEVDKRREHNCEKPKRERMDKYFSSAYRGDPGVPHADPCRFVNIWIGSLLLTASNCTNPYFWQTGSTTFNWHDRAMLYEQYHWKRAMKKNQPYEFLWNKTWDKSHRDSYYFNWPIYFT